MFFLTGCDQKHETVATIAEPELKEALTLKPMNLPEDNGIILPDSWNTKASLEISSNDNIIDSLYKLARAHNISINIHYDIDNTTNLIYRSNNKAIIDIIEEVCSLCNWKITISTNAIFITRDTPYLHIHAINLLNIATKSSVRTGLNTLDKDPNISGASGSSSILDTNTNTDIWNEIESYLTFLIESYKQTNQDIYLGKTEAFEQQQARLEEKEKQLAQDRALLQKAQELTVQTLEKQNNQNTMHDLSNTGNISQNENILSDLAPKKTDNELYTSSNSSKYTSKQRTSDVSYSINKQAGLIILRAPQFIHREVAKYLNYF